MARYKDRKRQQRKFNRIIKAMNENVANDDLWRGRFVARQIKTDYEKYRDGSGGCLWSYVDFKDKKTGYTFTFLIPNSIFLESRMYRAMNDFIVELCDVWADREELYNDKTDWRKYE